jgi:hypothetical protein
MAIPAMKCYIEKILVQDNCTCHGAPKVLSEMGSRNIRTIRLPSHFTHLLQVLGVSLFRAFKTNCKNNQSRPTNPRLEGKLLRVLMARYITAYAVTT